MAGLWLAAELGWMLLVAVHGVNNKIGSGHSLSHVHKPSVTTDPPARALEFSGRERLELGVSMRSPRQGCKLGVWRGRGREVSGITAMLDLGRIGEGARHCLSVLLCARLSWGCLASCARAGRCFESMRPV